MKKITVSLDMDNCLFDFDGAVGREYETAPIEMYQRGFFEHLKPIDGAVEAVQELLKIEEIELIIVSKPIFDSYYSYSEKVASVAKHFPRLLDKIVLCQDKHLVKSDILIDDSPEWSKAAKLFIRFNHRGDVRKQWKNIPNVVRGFVKENRVDQT